MSDLWQQRHGFLEEASSVCVHREQEWWGRVSLLSREAVKHWYRLNLQLEWLGK